MAKLVPDNKERLVVAGSLESGIPHDHAFGGSHSGYVGIDFVALFAGAHQENAIPLYRYPRMLGQFLNCVHQLRMFFIERFELVEQRIDDQRIDKDDPKQDGRAANQKYSHQRRGLRRITANRIKTRINAKNVPTNSSFVQSRNHDPQCCTDCSYRKDKECQYMRMGKSKISDVTISSGTNTNACNHRRPVTRSAKSRNLAATPIRSKISRTAMLTTYETKYSV